MMPKTLPNFHLALITILSRNNGILHIAPKVVGTVLRRLPKNEAWLHKVSTDKWRIPKNIGELATKGMLETERHIINTMISKWNCPFLQKMSVLTGESHLCRVISISRQTACCPIPWWSPVIAAPAGVSSFPGWVPEGADPIFCSLVFSSCHTPQLLLQIWRGEFG